jgi:hypothetical protein
MKAQGGLACLSCVVIIAIILILGADLAAGEAAPGVVTLEIPMTYREAFAGENIWFMARIPPDAPLPQGEGTENLVITSAIACGDVRSARTEVQPLSEDGGYMVKIVVPLEAEGPCALDVEIAHVGQAQATFYAIRTTNAYQDTIDNSLFDIILDIPQEFRIVQPDDQLITSVKLINVGSAGRVDVFFDLWVTDPAGTTVYKKRETVAVETQANFVRYVDITKEMGPGSYLLHAQITYADGLVAASQQSFTVERPWSTRIVLYGVLAGIGILIAAIVIVRWRAGAEEFRIRRLVRGIVKRRMK